MIKSPHEFKQLCLSEEKEKQDRIKNDEASIETWLEIIENYPSLKSAVILNKNLPHEILREVELSSWWIANCVNFFFLFIGIIALIYWSKKLKDFDDKGEEDKDVTAHSFL